MRVRQLHATAKVSVAVILFGSIDATAVDHSVLPTVTVSAGYISFGAGTWYSPDYLSSATAGGGGVGGIGAGAAMMASRERAWDLSKVCLSLASESAKSTTRHSDVTTRWLAAQEVFNVIQGKKLYNQYRSAVTGLRFLMDNQMYQGFKVTYADGWVETWAVNPAFQTSTIKLLDQPMPNSLKPSLDRGCVG